MSLQFHTTLITLFPEMFPGSLGHSLAGQALAQGIWGYQAVDLRAHGHGKHRSVDDTPYGGGAGMVLRPDVLDAALQEAKAIASSRLPDAPRLLAMSPRGRPLTQNHIKTLVKSKNLVIFAGRFEGMDQRLLDHHQVEEVSIGDYVLSGGEPAALVLMDACIRLIPGVMGAESSADEESFGPEGLLEYPHYTRPAVWQGMEVPPVLASGNHAAIAAWRQEQAEALTKTRRPDLWAKRMAASSAKKTDA
jgi:tRNA (guanine37-N1)-methyltransferase